jgi:predicted DCC family thiol-disulfide oxidoreductase YuxK
VLEPIPPFFLYDGACGFCQKWARWLELRVRCDVAFVPFQTVEDVTRYGLTISDVQSASYWIDDRGRAFRGSRSIAHALERAGGLWKIIGTVLDLPVVRVVAAAAYVVISRNRHRLPAPR